MAAAELLRERGAAQIGVVGHSLGGAWALMVAPRIDASAVAVAQPVDRMFDEVPLWLRPVYHVMGRIGNRRIQSGKPAGSLPYRVHHRHLFVDEEAAREAQREGYLKRRMSMANYDHATQVAARDWARDVTIPVLAILSHHDRVVDHERALRLVEQTQGIVEVLRHEGGHACFRDKDRAHVLHGVQDFMERHLGGA